MNYGDPVGAVSVRVGIYIVGDPMRCPPGVTDTNGAVQPDPPGVFGDSAFVLFDLNVATEALQSQTSHTPGIPVFLNPQGSGGPPAACQCNRQSRTRHITRELSGIMREITSRFPSRDALFPTMQFRNLATEPLFYIVPENSAELRAGRGPLDLQNTSC